MRGKQLGQKQTHGHVHRIAAAAAYSFRRRHERALERRQLGTGSALEQKACKRTQPGSAQEKGGEKGRLDAGVRCLVDRVD